MFRIETTDDLDSLLAASELWNELAGGVPFRETSWLGPWWRQFQGGKEPYLLLAKDNDNRLRGLLPLYRDVESTGGRKLCMMGDGDACSDYVSVLARKDDAIPIGESFGNHLAACSASGHRDGWDLLELDGVVEGDPAMSALATGLKTGGVTLHAHSPMSAWFRPRAQSWDEHLKSHSKTQRRRMRRWSEKIGHAVMEKVVAETDQQVDALLGALIEMHQRRWNLAGEPGSYADSRFRHFVFESAKEFRRRGRLYLVALKHDQRIIGAELNFVGGNRILYSYSAGYDLDSADLEPGRILGVDSLQQLYREDLAGIDFMRGDEAYKKRLGAVPRRLYRLRAVAPVWLPRLRHAAWCTGFEVKQWLRRRTGRPLADVADFTAPTACGE